MCQHRLTLHFRSLPCFRASAVDYNTFVQILNRPGGYDPAGTVGSYLFRDIELPRLDSQYSFEEDIQADVCDFLILLFLSSYLLDNRVLHDALFLS
jgi:hypothetical protein